MTFPSIAGVILAGGLSRRMGGGDKFLKTVGGKSLLTHVIQRITPQVGILALNLNGDLGRLNNEGLPVIADTLPNHCGPLAGILAGMEWAASLSPPMNFILTVPSDTPFLPTDLSARLFTSLEPQNSVAIAASNEKIHAVVGLWRVNLAKSLRHAMTVDGIRKVTDWAERCHSVIVSFPVIRRDPFFNINTPADLLYAEQETGVDIHRGQKVRSGS